MKNKLLYLLVSIFLAVVCIGGYVEAQQGPAGGGGGGGAGPTGPTGPTGPSSGVSSANVALTANQINHLFSAPVTLVAAPGVGKMILPISILFALNYGTVPFGGNGTNVCVDFSTSQLQGSSIACDNSLFEGEQLASSTALDHFAAPTGLAWQQGQGINVRLNSATANKALSIFNLTGDTITLGAIATSNITAGHAGLLYAPGDTFTDNVIGASIAVVDTVSVGGVVTSYHFTNPGYALSVGNGQSTSVLTGSGDGNLQIDITAITPGDGTGSVTVIYTTITLP